MASTAAPFIKGYLPVRLVLPCTRSDESDETFFYVKEHHQNVSSATSAAAADHKKNNSTLFVANAPVVPFVKTRLLLKSLFGRYGQVSRVTVVENPRRRPQQQQQQQQNTTFATDDDNVDSLLAWTDKFRAPSFVAPILSEGKFAHVVFASQKEMKRALRSLCKVMMSNTIGKEKDDDDDLPGIHLDKIEIQTLADESDRQYREENGLEDEEEDDERDVAKPTGLLAVAERYRASCRKLSSSSSRRQALLEECNAVMQEFEDAEERDRLAREAAAANQADDDGFITVRYSSSSQVGSKRELEQDATAASAKSFVESNKRRKGHKRSRKKKEKNSGEGLTDFYRFQTRANRKKTLQELRQRFEEDLEKVKKMKEERQYRPF